MSRMWPLHNTCVPNTLHSHPVSPYYYKCSLIWSFSILPCSPQFILHTAARTMLWKTCHITSLLCSTHKIALYLIRTNSKPLALAYDGLHDLVPNTSISFLSLSLHSSVFHSYLPPCCFLKTSSLLLQPEFCNSNFICQNLLTPNQTSILPPQFWWDSAQVHFSERPSFTLT